MNFKAYTLFSVALVMVFYCVFCYKSKPKIAQTGDLVVGTSADYPPYAFVDITTNTVVGFDVDVAQEITRRMNKKCKIQDTPFLSLILGLLAGDIDIVAAGITPTERRAKKVSFSENYLEQDPLVAVHKKNTIITSLGDLTRLSIVVNTGYTADLFLNKIPNIHLTKLDSPSEAIMALSSNTVDAFVCAQSSLQKMMQSKKLDDFSLFIIPDTGDSYALAVNKDRPEFLKEINDALLSMKKDGTLELLQKKWGLK